MRRTFNITTNPAEIRIPANQTEFESELPVGGNVDSVGVVVAVVVVAGKTSYDHDHSLD